MHCRFAIRTYPSLVLAMSTEPWTEAWDRLNFAFQNLTEALLVRWPHLSWACDHHDNEAFPFFAVASYSIRGPQEDDAVISVDFHGTGTTLRYSSDVADEEGVNIVLEGPSGRVERPGSDGWDERHFWRVVDELCIFVTSSRPLVEQALSRFDPGPS